MRMGPSVFRQKEEKRKAFGKIFEPCFGQSDTRSLYVYWQNDPLEAGSPLGADGIGPLRTALKGLDEPEITALVEQNRITKI